MRFVLEVEEVTGVDEHSCVEQGERYLSGALFEGMFTDVETMKAVS